MLRQFLRDKRGNYLMITALVMPVLFGSLTIGIDYADMSRQCQNTLNAVDAATFAASRRLLEGAPNDEVRKYARDFFDANLSAAPPGDVELAVNLPANSRGGGEIALNSILTYKPHFLGAFLGLLGRDEPVLQCRNSSVVRLQNTVEAVLVLDNSGSMLTDPATGKNKVPGGSSRMDLLQSAASQLVDQLAVAAKLMVQVEKPVQLAVVPFSASVNVGPDYGPDNKNASWLDVDGRSPVHHENFDWSQPVATDRLFEKETETGRIKKVGSGWKDKEGTYVTRFSLFKDLTQCTNSKCTAQDIKPANVTWKGCVEARPYPYNTNDEPPRVGTPATLFVPMFAPDEAGTVGETISSNSWWDDAWSGSKSDLLGRQRYGAKYYSPLQYSLTPPNTMGRGPHWSCWTTPITPLTDVTTDAGKQTIKDAINTMRPTGDTNVPEAFAWGWRVVSSQEPFTQGRPERERGNDKVVILLTDGANTYTSGKVNAANNKSTYAAYAYAFLAHLNENGRIFKGVAKPPSTSAAWGTLNFPTAMNDLFLQTCTNANGGNTGNPGAGLIVMTVALDLNEKISSEKTQIDLLEKCASQSRYSKKKLFWNAESANLNEVFRQIADELSNMRLVR